MDFTTRNSEGMVYLVWPPSGPDRTRPRGYVRFDKEPEMAVLMSGRETQSGGSIAEGNLDMALRIAEAKDEYGVLGKVWRESTESGPRNIFERLLRRRSRVKFSLIVDGIHSGRVVWFQGAINHFEFDKVRITRMSKASALMEHKDLFAGGEIEWD